MEVQKDNMEVHEELVHFSFRGLGLFHHGSCEVELGYPHHCLILGNHLSSNVENHSLYKKEINQIH